MAIRRLQPVLQDSFLVTIGGYEQYWSTFSGGEKTYSTTKVKEGLSNSTVIVKGGYDITDITLSKPYDPEADDPMLQEFETLCDDNPRLTVTVQPGAFCNGDFSAKGSPYTYQGCQITNLVPPAVDKDSSSAATISITLAAEQRTKG